MNTFDETVRIVRGTRMDRHGNPTTAAVSFDVPQCVIDFGTPATSFGVGRDSSSNPVTIIATAEPVQPILHGDTVIIRNVRYLVRGDVVAHIDSGFAPLSSWIMTAERAVG